MSDVGNEGLMGVVGAEVMLDTACSYEYSGLAEVNDDDEERLSCAAPTIA